MHDYNTLYSQKLVTASHIAGQVRSDWNCWIDIALGQPQSIIQALGEAAKKNLFSNVKVHTMLDTYPMAWFSEDMQENLKGVSWFSGGQARKAIKAGYGELVPCYYRDMPALIDQYVDIDCFMACVSPMDRHGYFSLGTTCSNSIAAMKKAKYIFIEVNEHMPRALNGALVHISEVTSICEHHSELPVAAPAVIDPVSSTIGNIIAEEVPDGATLQLGIGAIPDAVGFALKSKKNLGIHTELFGDSMAELIECGAVDNSRKEINRGKCVTTFAFGSSRVYDYINDNPAFVLAPSNYVNNPEVIAQHSNFISVNAAVEVDMYGQVCAESIGTRHLSGTGGQVDYVRGAVQSKGGKSFIAFPSTAQNGKISRIQFTLSPGAVVTTGKNDVDHIVTEYGVARLRGKTLSERTKALIGIAHPSFREELTFQAKQSNYIV